MNVFDAAREALAEGEPARRCALARELRTAWDRGDLRVEGARATVLPAGDVPGAPGVVLVPPRDVPQRGPGSREGRAALYHALAHIEFNAIALALDAVQRYRDLPREFVDGWIRVADEEAVHFGLLRERLEALGARYGDFPAHGGLWAMAVQTADDPLVRMALVPRVLEARGLDATPPVMERLESVGDRDGVAALGVILRDEVGHVALGDRWFRRLCAERGLDADATWVELVVRHGAPWPHEPLNVEARLRAGFTPGEIDRIRAGRPRAT